MSRNKHHQSSTSSHRRVYSPELRTTILAHAERHGVAAAMAHYGVSGASVYLWRKLHAVPTPAATASPGSPIVDALCSHYATTTRNGLPGYDVSVLLTVGWFMSESRNADAVSYLQFALCLSNDATPATTR